MFVITYGINKCGMPHVMFDVTLLDTLGCHFRFVFSVGNVEGIHFCPETTNSLGGTELVSSLNLPMTFALTELKRELDLGYALVS